MIRNQCLARSVSALQFEVNLRVLFLGSGDLDSKMERNFANDLILNKPAGRRPKGRLHYIQAVLFRHALKDPGSVSVEHQFPAIPDSRQRPSDALQQRPRADGLVVEAYHFASSGQLYFRSG